MVWNSFCIWGSGTESFALCRCQLPIGEDSKSVLFARTSPTLCGVHTATLWGVHTAILWCPHCHTVWCPHSHTVGPHSQVCYSGKFSPSLACLQSSTRTAAVSVIKADRNQRGNNFLISKSDQDSLGWQKRQGWHFVASPSLSKCSEPSLPQMPHFRFSIPCAQYHAIPRNTTQYQFCLRRPSSGSQGKEGEGGIEQRRGEDKRVKSSMEVFFNNVSVKVAVKRSWIWPEFEQSRNRYRERSCAISGKAIKVELRSIQQMNFTHSAPWPYSH